MPRLGSVFGLATSLVLAACTATIDRAYETIAKDSRAPIDSYEQAVMLPDIKEITPGVVLRRELSEESLLINANGHRTVFDIFAFSADAGQKFEVTVDCVIMPGLTASTILPSVVVVDELGQPLKTDFKRGMHGPTFTEGSKMLANAMGRIDRNAHLYVLVIADVGSRGQSLGSNPLYVVSPTPMVLGDIPIVPVPFGPFRIELKLSP